MNIELHLDELLDRREDSISGRTFGQGYAMQNEIMQNLENGNTFSIIISDKIKAINDSFWKGFFSEVFKKYRTIEKVESFFNFSCDPYFKKLIDQNFKVLEAIYNV